MSVSCFTSTNSHLCKFLRTTGRDWRNTIYIECGDCQRAASRSCKNLYFLIERLFLWRQFSFAFVSHKSSVSTFFTNISLYNFSFSIMESLKQSCIINVTLYRNTYFPEIIKPS